MSAVTNQKKVEKQNVVTTENQYIGQTFDSIGIGDGSVVTIMKKRGRKPGKKKELIFNYKPSDTHYTPQQLEEYRIKEHQLIQYVIEHLLHQEAPSN
ncbi:hypothetical protein [Brevibacillus borstelensis]|uniref:hypothetical protein n=1 Tax=Brevibacillus borstelensis TaxID=45462 RepID=UPI002E1D7487|nr:hypothetical protein [Brevibacillus borstelensis]